MKLSVYNNTSTSLLAGATFQGGFEINQEADINVLLVSDTDGLLYFDYSDDGVNFTTHPANGYTVRANVKEWKFDRKMGNQCRIVFVNGSTPQTSFTLKTYFGAFSDTKVGAEQVVDRTVTALYTRTLNKYDIARGLLSYASAFTKFGANLNVSTTSVPITTSGVYRTPTTATALEVVSTDAADGAAGAGARSITVIGLDANWLEVQQTVTMNGLTPVPIPTPLLRVYRVFVETSGTYATETAGSHVGTITVRSVSGANTWANLAIVNGFPTGQSLIAAYTVPANKRLYINAVQLSANINRVISFQLFKRDNADVVAAPFSAMRVQRYWNQIDASLDEEYIQVFEPKTDVGFLTFASGGSGNIASAVMKGVLFDL